MTREELIAYDRWLTENKWGSSEIITPEQAADLYLAKHPLPPAEGAEEMSAREYLDKWMDEHHHLSDRLIGWSVAADFAEDFATLHAQRLAEKMVEERMEQYKAQFKDRPNPLEVNPYDSKGIKRIRNRKIH